MVQETITSNIHDDIITLEFQRTDGTLITQLIDFRSVSIVTFSNGFGQLGQQGLKLKSFELFAWVHLLFFVLLEETVDPIRYPGKNSKLVLRGSWML